MQIFVNKNTAEVLTLEEFRQKLMDAPMDERNEWEEMELRKC